MPVEMVTADATAPLARLAAACRALQEAPTVDALRGAIAEQGRRLADDLRSSEALELAEAQLAAFGAVVLEAAERREAEAAMRDARRKLLATVAHDLRNPLNTFAMSADLFREDLERGAVDATRALSLFSRMERATLRMKVLIEELVEASHLDTGDLEVSPREERAATMLSEAATAAAAALAEKHVTIALEGLDLEARAMVDRSHTVQLLTKVIAVATKSTGEGGKIVLGVRAEGHAVIFTARAFGASGAPVAPPEDGRGGLALVVARGFAAVQRGALCIEPGDAFTITVTLPIVTS
jgi:signal transduction histidine kinase